MKARMRDGSGHRSYRYLKEDTDRHGNVRIYFHRNGQPKIRLRATPGTDEFEREYQQAYNSAPNRSATGKDGSAKPDTLLWLVQQYYGSTAFKGLDVGTRNVRRGILDGLCQQTTPNGPVGGFRFALMTEREVAILRDQKAEFPHSANARVKALRQVFSWACESEYRYAIKNPAAGVKYLKGKNPEGFRPWTEEDARKYEDCHPIGTQARLAFDLLLYTGVRRSDVVKLGPQMERTVDEEQPDGSIIRVIKLFFRETKGRNHVVKEHSLPILPPLRASIDATPTGQLVYLPTRQGHPRSVKAFGNWFSRQCKAAGLTGISAHGVRKLSTVRAIHAGATSQQLMALFGWTNENQIKTYARKVNRAKLEATAAGLLVRK